MAENAEQTIDYPRMRRSTTLAGIIETMEWVIIALILAFIFRAFVMEAFRIPTGSMADTLHGAHFHLRCTRCGYGYDVGGDYYTTLKPQCPSCGYVLPSGTPMSVSNGDRILVLKCIYQFVEPKRWDVVVFKNPLDPSENYIKRMIAGAGETVEIVDGDIYINGQIARKPANVQEELWMPIYDNDYQPPAEMMKRPGEKRKEPSNGNFLWQQPFENDAVSHWELNADGPTVFALDSDPEQVNIIYYDAQIGNDFKAKYAYNNSSSYFRRPSCSDLMVRFHVTPGSSEGLIGITLRKYGTYYHGHVNFSGEMVIEKADGDISFELARRKITNVTKDEAVRLRFANVDHQLVLEFGNEKLKYDLGPGPADAGEITRKDPSEVRIFGAGKIRLSHLSLFRDIYYTSNGSLRAGEGNPFTLNEDEYFVCGDNSPYSQDARRWETEGIGNNGVRYRTGTVPRDYLVGKAILVYWSDAFKPHENFMPVIPNIGRIQFIQGGSGKKL